MILIKSDQSEQMFLSFSFCSSGAYCASFVLINKLIFRTFFSIMNIYVFASKTKGISIMYYLLGLIFSSEPISMVFSNF